MFGADRRIVLPRPHSAAKRWALSAGAATATSGRRLRVVDIVRDTADAVTLHLACIDGAPLPFKAGQYLTHCFEVDGQSLKRAYSISAAEGQPLACTIKAVAQGAASQYALNDLKVGDEYQALGPSGDFTLPADGQCPLAFLAAGSGITPVISLIETALRQNPARSIRLVYASRRQGQIIFESRLRALVLAHPSLQIVHVLSQPTKGWKGERGRLDGPHAAALLAAPTDAEVFLCGPAELMDATAGALKLPAAQIHRERFLAAPRHTRALPTSPQEIQFRRSGKSATQRPGESLLQAGLRAGIALPFSCTVGGCAACKLKVLDGEVQLDEPNCLSPEERAEGYTLSCSSYCLGPVVIDA